MIKIQKKLFVSVSCPKNSSNFKRGILARIFVIVLAAISCLLAAIFYALKFNHHFLKIIIIFLFSDIFSVIIIFKLQIRNQRLLTLAQQDIQEKINTLQNNLAKLNLEKSALNLKVKRYWDLRFLTQDLNSVFLESPTAEALLESTCHMVGSDKGNCLLYLIDKSKHELSLFMAKKQAFDEVIRAKKGDIFDQWVMRHGLPLLILDAKNDFRFDPEMVTQSSGQRDIGALAASPILSVDKFLGIIRLDNRDINSYDTEDLRLLSTIADLASLALENAQLYEHTQELAIRDGLTNLYVRRFFLERLDQELGRADTEGNPLSLLMIDIDHFKDYNDKFGHIVGDIVLKNIANWLNEKFASDANLICRFGGEEFVVVLPNTDKEKACDEAESFKDMVKHQKITLRRHPSSITVSIGVAVFPGDARLRDELISAADSALYKAKNSGRDKVCTI